LSNIASSAVISFANEKQNFIWEIACELMQNKKKAKAFVVVRRSLRTPKASKKPFCKTPKFFELNNNIKSLIYAVSRKRQTGSNTSPVNLCVLTKDNH